MAHPLNQPKVTFENPVHNPLPSDFFIRKAQFDDMQDLAQVAMETFRSTYSLNPQDMDAYLSSAFSLDTLNQELTDSHSQYFVLCHTDDHIVGYAKINILNSQTIPEYTSTQPNIANFIQIQRLYILQHYQSFKLGSKFMTYLIFYAQHFRSVSGYPFEKVWLTVWNENHRAIQFYQRFLFEQVDSITFCLGASSTIDYVMALDLTDNNLSELVTSSNNRFNQENNLEYKL